MNEAALTRWMLDPAALFEDAVSRVMGKPISPDPWQKKALRSRSSRQLYLTSRQAGKSSTAAAKALHAAMVEDKATVLLLSPTLEQSKEIYKKARDYYRVLGHPLGMKSESALRMELGNGSRILSLPGSERSIVGYTASLLCIDEAARTPPELLEAALPMVSVSGGSVMALSTPFGARGWFYELATSRDKNWEHFRITADECPRITPGIIEEARQLRGERYVKQEFYCSFEDAQGQVFSGEVIQRMLDVGEGELSLEEELALRLGDDYVADILE